MQDARAGRSVIASCRSHVVAALIRRSRGEKAHPCDALLSQEATHRIQLAWRIHIRNRRRANLKPCADPVWIRFDSLDASKAR
jgi:hypothetical protein